MAQSLDQSVASTTASSVYVIGQQSNDLPIELFYASRDAEFENRYERTLAFFESPDNNASPQSIQWTIMQSNSFMRGRSMMAGFCFNTPRPANATNNLCAQYFAVTPLPAFTVTYWDQIEMKFGYNATPVYTLTTTQHIPFMMRLMGYFKINDTNKNSLAMGGMYFFDNFDYNGGISGAASTTYPANPAATGDPYLNNPGVAATPNWITQLPVTPFNMSINESPYTTLVTPGLWTPMNVFATYTDNSPVRQGEGGIWLSESMQKLRANFYGNYNCTESYGAVKLDVISEVFMTPCVMPPVPLSFKFNYPYSNAVRPRYINTPITALPAAAGPVLAYDTALPTGAAAYAGITPLTGNCYMLYETVAFRADMHSAVLLAWKNNAGINDRFRSYDWYEQQQITSSTLQINLIQANNFVSYQSIIGLRMQYPWGVGAGYVDTNAGTTVTQTIPAAAQLVPYTWSDCQLKQASATYAIPYNLEQIRINWQNGGNEPLSYSNYQTRASTQRGILDYQSAWKDMYQDTMWFTTPNFSDYRFNDQLASRYQNNFALPVGYQAQAPNANVTQYGTHSFVSAPGGAGATAWNSGPHNQFIEFYYNGLDFHEEVQDYGTAMGSLRILLNFFNPPPQPGVIFDHLMPYLININYQGSLNVTTSLQV